MGLELSPSSPEEWASAVALQLEKHRGDAYELPLHGVGMATAGPVLAANTALAEYDAARSRAQAALLAVVEACDQKGREQERLFLLERIQLAARRAVAASSVEAPSAKHMRATWATLQQTLHDLFEEEGKLHV